MQRPILQRLLLCITARLPGREISGEHGEPYLERYYVCSLLGWHVYIHRFLASDPDRGLHDHPWDNSISLILAGGYRELRTYSYRILRPWRINRIRGNDFHRILLDPGREAWTLFFHGPRTKGWGFRRNGEYTPFADHKDDYPAARWWETAPRGRELRQAHVAKFILDEWLHDFRKVLCDAGLSQSQAMAVTLEEYGLAGKKADLTICPLCCARSWLLRRGMIPPAFGTYKYESHEQ